MALSKKSKTLLTGGVLTAAALIPLLYRQNNSVTVSEFSCFDSSLPEGFDGCRVLHVSDLHNKSFGYAQEKLIVAVSTLAPDFIVVTGDLVHNGRDINNALDFMRIAAKIAPVYYTPGNHEKKSGRYYELAEELKRSGVHVLFNRVEQITRKGSSIAVMGIADPRFLGYEYLDMGVKEKFCHRLSELKERAGDDYTLLLSHRPELIEFYAQNNIDVAFCGHAHGGQMRIPVLGGLVAPGQGLFPKYTSGIYRLGPTTMVVSRGLGNSAMKLRIANRPELVLATLRKV